MMISPANPLLFEACAPDIHPLIDVGSDEYHVRVAKTIDETKELLEVGFEYVTDLDDVKLFRKRK